MRLVIAVDATHLKSKYKSVMFVANAFDSNRNLYPLAFGIEDLETNASWHWFFTKLHEAIGECLNLVIISNRNVSIENVWGKQEKAYLVKNPKEMTLNAPRRKENGRFENPRPFQQRRTSSF
ncbi:unnamed protein product [Prunus armeniaca]